MLSNTKPSQLFFFFFSTAILLLSLCIYPLGWIEVQTQNAALEKGMAVSAPITEDAAMAGIFQPVHERLTSIGFRFYVPGSRDNSGYIRFVLKDQYDTVLAETTVPICEIKNNTYYEFTQTDLSFHAGAPYIFQLNAYEYGDTAPCIYLGSPDVASTEYQALYHNGLVLPDNAPIAVYSYQAKASLQQALPYFIVIFSLGLLFILSCQTNTEEALIEENTNRQEDTSL